MKVQWKKPGIKQCHLMVRRSSGLVTAAAVSALTVGLLFFIHHEKHSHEKPPTEIKRLRFEEPLPTDNSFFVKINRRKGMPGANVRNGNDGDTLSIIKEENMAATNHLSIKKQAWIFTKKEYDYDKFEHIENVLKALGYTCDGGPDTDWDFMWAQGYPWKYDDMLDTMLSLKPHQKVSKLPGTSYVTSKVSLATSGLKNVPKAFELPEGITELKQYAKKYPRKLWMQKNSKHRGIRIVPISHMDLTKDTTFVQEFIGRPLLIDKRKFDIAVFTVITSVEPLRIYTVDHILNIRFCSKDYYPFDEEDVDKYVVRDDFTKYWEIPSLKKYSDLGYSGKEAFRQHLTGEGVQVDQIYAEMEETIRQAYLSFLPKFQKKMETYNNRNFFEMVRFDFVLDENLNVYLMEANMSPNLASNKVKENSAMYEQVLYNMFHLVGLDRNNVTAPLGEFSVHSEDLSVYPNVCLKNCISATSEDICKLCQICLSKETKEILSQAFEEHTNRRNMKRIMPPPLDQESAEKKPDHWSLLPDVDKTQHLWFVGKCLLDKTWC